MPDLYTIVNNTVVSIKNCEDEPIKIPGSIQPHGFLFAINRHTGVIDLCSANTEKFLGQPPAYFLGQPCASILPAELSKIIRQLPDVDSEVSNQKIPDTKALGPLTFDCFRHVAGSYIILECVESLPHNLGTNELFAQTSELLTSSDTETTLVDLCNKLTENIRQITGFDRVMVYKFDGEYNGRVFGESVGTDVDSFLGLHYPHTDIPKQARDLYLKNPFRLIPDVAYEPVPIVTLDAGLARPEILSLADVHIRSVSPIHITYLKNMGVGASMSISIIKNGQLWGLVACHHNSEKPLIYIRQFQAYILARILSSQIVAFEAKEQYTSAKNLDVPFRELMGYLKRQENFIELHFQNLEAVTAIVNASGAVLIYNNQVYTNGIVPPLAFIFLLKSWLDEKVEEEYSTVDLSKHFQPAAEYLDIASGLLYKQLDKESKTVLLWFRPSAVTVTEWAGNPRVGEKTGNLTPRNSFESWKEITKGTSAVWNQPELDNAFRFSYLLQQHMLNLLKYENDLKNRILNEQLSKANKELENINWISNHDLKEPLRKIQVFASMIDATKSVPTVDTVNKSIKRIKLAATKMQQFIEDLFRYSQMSGIEMKYENVDLAQVITSVLEEFSEEKDNGFFHLQCSEMPTIKASRFQMKQLFINLIDNSIKFRKEDQKQAIDISCEQVNDSTIVSTGTVLWNKITISDKGIGFSTDVSTSVFDIFKRGHSNLSIQGSGVGLSICKKIMENHGGKISASGAEGEGAAIILHFPISEK